MSDLERDLVAVLDREARDLDHTPVIAPVDLLGRARRRQARTLAVAAVVAAAITVGSAAGIRSMLDGASPQPATPKPPPRGNVVTTMAVGGVTIDAPRGWWLLPRSGHDVRSNGPTQPSVWPILQVTNFWPGPPDGPWCPEQPGDPGSFPATGVLLYVQQDFFLGGRAAGPWPLTADRIVFSRPSTGICRGPGPMRWLAAGRSFEAYLVAGPEASGEDRAKLVTAFGRMRFGPAYPDPNRGVVPVTDWSTILSGRAAGEAWRLQVRDTTIGPCDRLDYPDAQTADCPLYVGPDFALGISLELVHGPNGRVATFLTGALSRDASRVEVRLDDGRTLQAIIVGIPEEFLAPYDRTTQVYVAVVEGRVSSGTIVALDAGGRVLSQGDVPDYPLGS